MTHIVQVSFDFEDEYIKQRLQDTAYDEVLNKIKNEVENEIFHKDKYGYGNSAIKTLSFKSEQILEKCITDMKPEIVELAAKFVAEKIYRSKAVKNMIKELTETGEENDEN